MQKQVAAFQSQYPQITATLAQPLGFEADELLFAVLDERILNAKPQKRLDPVPNNS